MSDVKFYKASQDLKDPSADCNSLKSGQLLMLNHPAGQVVDEHAHDETHVIFVRQGRINFKIKDESYDMSAGDTLVIPPGTPHSFTVLGGEACRTACLSV